MWKVTVPDGAKPYNPCPASSSPSRTQIPDRLHPLDCVEGTLLGVEFENYLVFQNL